MSDVGAEDSAGSVVWLSPDPPGWIADFSLVPLASQFSQICNHQKPCKWQTFHVTL